MYVCICMYVYMCMYVCFNSLSCVEMLQMTNIYMYAQTLMFSRHTLVLLEDGKERGGGSTTTAGMDDKPSVGKKYGLVKRG